MQHAVASNPKPPWCIKKNNLTVVRQLPCRFYEEVQLKWDSFTVRGLALLLLGLADLVATAPPEGIQRGLIKAIRSSFKKPQSSEELRGMILEAAAVPVAGNLEGPLWVDRFFVELQYKWGFAHSLATPSSRAFTDRSFTAEIGDEQLGQFQSQAAAAALPP